MAETIRWDGKGQSLPPHAVVSGLMRFRYRTTSDATDAVLRAVAQLLGMRTTWISRIERSASEAFVVASLNEAGGCGVTAGAVLPAQDTY